MTLKDVAAATDLSPAAVSYALRGIHTAPETQERVKQVAADLGYTGNAVARALSQGRTGLVGVVAASLQDLGEQSFVAAIGQALEQHGLHMVLVDSGGEPERERALAIQLADQMCDGLVVSPLDPSDPSWAAVGETLPIVTVGDALAGPTVGEVLFDNRAGVSLVLEHFAELGHERVAVLTPSRPSTPERPAEQVIGSLCRRLGLEATVVNSRHSIEDATRTATGLLTSDPRPTAVFCLSDSIACGVYAAAAALGLSIPGDVSVAGYDDHPIATSLAPSLTTVMWGMSDLAKSASALIAAAVDGKPRKGARARVRVEPQLVRRDSTAPRRL